MEIGTEKERERSGRQLWLVGVAVVAIMFMMTLVVAALVGGGNGRNETTAVPESSQVEEVEVDGVSEPGEVDESDLETSMPTASSQGRGDAGHGQHEHEADSSTVLDAAVAASTFVDAWLLVGDSVERTRALEPVTAPPLLRALADIDLGRLPDASRAGEPESVASGTYQVAFHIELTDDSVVEVVMVDDGNGGWRATNIHTVN
ncbi:hypothetical protein [Phytoactinopolyspora mesophila]|uniref:Uncharacterized protein n=1 Tax=Phytoactinopolyspora mesophila TaxID=2650750 RepID=A0A7K3MCB1_9ACTN|nr:hypothetical protein [Phytoactinopolyspora mesophila]NDL60965.1 hypothetical protein [Phytoactinopolyspora mesophila]